MSFLKKLIKKKDEEQNRSPPGAGPTKVQTMSAELQMKYAKGVQYNSEYAISKYIW